MPVTAYCMCKRLFEPCHEPAGRDQAGCNVLVTQACQYEVLQANKSGGTARQHNPAMIHNQQ